MANENLINVPSYEDFDADRNRRVDLQAGGADIDLSSLVGILRVSGGDAYADSTMDHILEGSIYGRVLGNSLSSGRVTKLTGGEKKDLTVSLGGSNRVFTLGANVALNQNLRIADSPQLAGLTLTGFSGVLKASVGVLAGSADHSDLGSIGTGDHHAQLHASSHNNTAADELNHDNLAGVVAAEHSVESGLQFVIDGGDNEISTGIKGDLEVPFNCVVQSITLLADQTGSIKIDIWKDTYANFPPDNNDTITGGNEPEISGGVKDQDTTLTSWTTSLSKGNILRLNVDSVSDIQRVTISLKVNKT